MEKAEAKGLRSAHRLWEVHQDLLAPRQEKIDEGHFEASQPSQRRRQASQEPLPAMKGWATTKKSSEGLSEHHLIFNLSLKGTIIFIIIVTKHIN